LLKKSAGYPKKTPFTDHAIIMALPNSLRLIATIPALLSLTLTQVAVQARSPLFLSVNFPSATPGGGSAPQRTAGGAPRRGSEEECVAKFADLNGDGEVDPLTPLTALMPASNIGTSLSPDPTLSFYVPRTKATAVEIVVQKRMPVMTAGGATRYQYEEVYYNDGLAVPPGLTDGPRIVSYALEAVNLEPGAVYEWSFSLLCESSGEGEEVVSGLLSCSQADGSPLGCSATATIPDPKTLAPAALQANASRFAANAYWNEALAFTAQLRPVDRQQWKTLLESQGLGCLADVPFAGEAIAPNSPQAQPLWDPQCFVE